MALGLSGPEFKGSQRNDLGDRLSKRTGGSWSLHWNLLRWEFAPLHQHSQNSKAKGPAPWGPVMHLQLNNLDLLVFWVYPRVRAQGRLLVVLEGFGPVSGHVLKSALATGLLAPAFNVKRFV